MTKPPEHFEQFWRSATPENAVNRILASRGNRHPNDVVPQKRIVSAISKEHRSKVLDFGAGVGRNTYGLAEICDKVWAFDFPNMIEMLTNNPKFNNSNIKASVDWAAVKVEKFSAIYAIIVLQHIHIDVVRSYLKDFTKMTGNLYVQSRSYSDYEKFSMYDLLMEHWDIDESFGYSSIEKVKNAHDNDHYFIRLNPKREE